MASRIAVSLLLALVSIVGVNAYGQTVALPQPVAVVKDADGKVVAQVAGLELDDTGTALAILAIDGIPALVRVSYLGLRAWPGSSVWFSEPNCTGSAYVQVPSQTGIEGMTHVRVVILGPDSALGTYRVFRSTSPSPLMVDYESRLSQGWGAECANDPGTLQVSSAAEVLPNPLEGFHGPTYANPDRTWTIEGGDRLQ